MSNIIERFLSSGKTDGLDILSAALNEIDKPISELINKYQGPDCIFLYKALVDAAELIKQQAPVPAFLWELTLNKLNEALPSQMVSICVKRGDHDGV